MIEVRGAQTDYRKEGKKRILFHFQCCVITGTDPGGRVVSMLNEIQKSSSFSSLLISDKLTYE